MIRGGSGLVTRHPKLTLAAAVLAGLGLSAVLRQMPSRTTLDSSPVVEAVLADAGSPSVGPTSADVTIVVFTDYQCPVCRRTDPALDRVHRKSPNVRLIYKDWPILGENSRHAARIALAAERQGKYLALHNAMMASPGSMTPTRVKSLASGVGIDWPRLERDLAKNGPMIDAQLKRHAFQAWSLGLEGTPAYVVGPFLIKGGMSEAALRGAISSARKRNRAVPRFDDNNIHVQFPGAAPG